MTCRDEVLACAEAVVRRTGTNRFTIGDILDCMRARETQYKDSTIRTHVTSLMCINAPQHHEMKYRDFERVGRGLYRLVK